MIILNSKNSTNKTGSYLKYNSLNGNYKARNELANNIFSLEQATQQEIPIEPVPEALQDSVGYVSVSVFTASGALPVPDALITIYIFDINGQESEIIRRITDANGQIPVITLPVIYDPFDPFESREFYFSTYNLRAQAINYYTVNIIDLRVFPNTTTNLTIDMIPAAVGPTIGPDMTFVIPPSLIDISNE